MDGGVTWNFVNLAFHTSISNFLLCIFLMFWLTHFLILLLRSLLCCSQGIILNSFFYLLLYYNPLMKISTKFCSHSSNLLWSIRPYITRFITISCCLQSNSQGQLRLMTENSRSCCTITPQGQHQDETSSHTHTHKQWAYSLWSANSQRLYNVNLITDSIPTAATQHMPWMNAPSHITTDSAAG